MTTPPNQHPDRWFTPGTVRWRTAPDFPTMAGYVPPTVASRAVTEFDAAVPMTARQPYVPDLAWSHEQPEFEPPPPITRPQSWIMRSRVLTFVGCGLVAAATAGLFASLYGAHSTPVDATTSHSAPTPAAAPVNPPPAKLVQTPDSRTNFVVTRHVATAGRGSSAYTTSHQSPPPNSASSSSAQHHNDQTGQPIDAQQWPSNRNTVSTPPTWNRNDYYWFTHRRDDDGGWTRSHDGDDRSPSDQDDNGQSSHDQRTDNYSTGSDGNASSDVAK